MENMTKRQLMDERHRIVLQCSAEGNLPDDDTRRALIAYYTKRLGEIDLEYGRRLAQERS